MEDFLYDYSISNWPNKENYKDIYIFLCKIKKIIPTATDNDSINFLAYLYYWKRLWCPEIYKIVWHLSHYPEYSKLNYLFREIFLWELRSKWEMSTNKQSRMDKEIEFKREVVRTEISDLLDIGEFNEDKCAVFEMDVFTHINTKKAKIIYILKYLLGLNEKKVLELLINLKNKWVWKVSMAREIKLFFDNMWYWNLVNVDKDTISRIIKTN